MGSLFSSPNVPKPQQPPPAAKEEDRAVQEAAAAAAARRKRARGFRSTVLGNSFVAADAPAAKSETLGT